MLSKRVRGLRLSPLQEFFRKARDMELKGEDVISLAVGEPNFSTPVYIREAGIKAIESGETRYTAAGGMMELREAAAADFWRTGITTAKANNTLISAGSQPLIAAAMLVLCDQGDKVLVPAPYYPPYLTLASIFGVKPVLVDTSADGFMLTTRSVEKAMKKCFFKKPGVIVLNTPNNPTGMVWAINELLGLQELDLCFIVDEAYSRIVYGPKYVCLASFPGMAKRTITIRSCSKSHLMSGWRIGYLTGPQELVDKIELYLEASMVSACAISQKAAIYALKALPEEPRSELKEMVRQLGIRKNCVLAWLDKHNIDYPVPQGAFYVFPNLPERVGMDSTTLADLLLEEAKVVVTPGMAFGGELYDGYIRMSYASVSSIERLQQGLERIEEALKL